MKYLSLALILLVLTGVARAEDATTLIQSGDKLDDQFKTQEALALYLQADKLKPNDAMILQKIAREYGLSMDDVSDTPSKIERGQKALDYAKRAVAADDKNSLAVLALSISYGRLAQISDNKAKITYAKYVKVYAEQARDLDPSNDLPYYVLGSWNYGFANLNAFVRALVRIMYGSLPPASNEEAIKDFQKAIELNPYRLGSHESLGEAYLAVGNKDLARKEFQTSLALPIHDKDDTNAKAKARAALQKL